jgi:CheY-like chemotaxis protein
MRFTFRTKLMVMMAAAALAFVVLVAGTRMIATRNQNELETIQQRYLPKMDLGPRLEADFEHLRRSFQDAVAAHDLDALAATRELKNGMIEQLAAGRDFLDPAAAVAFKTALDDYHATAADVSRRLISGETGEALVGAMGAMQAKQSRVMELLKAATRLDRGELKDALATIARTQATVARIRTWLTAGCLALVILLAIWLGRGVVRSVGALEVGLRRFGRGDFSQPIAVVGQDELGDVAVQANQMAESLKVLSTERDRTDWIKNGQTGLAQELRGDLEPPEVATRAVRFLARTVEAPAAALYYCEPDRTLKLLGHHALAMSAAGEGAVAAFGAGEGLVGQAALQEEITVITDPPADYLRIRSGLGEGPPRAIVLVPLSQGGRITAVLELALFKPWSPAAQELMLSVRETLAIAIEVARARAAMRDLLAATQRQAQRLATQEEELRATNEELQTQEEELRSTNTDLTHQTEELEAQRHALSEKNVELDDARLRLEQRAGELAAVSAYKSQFLANMSHELRTPLNSMLLLSNLLSENESGTLTPKQIEFARTIYSAGKDLLALINQVLDLAKVESGKQEVQIVSVGLHELADHAERVFGPLAREKGLTFVVTVADDLPANILTDKRRLEQILNNFLGNAIKFTPRGQVALRIARPAPGVRFRRNDLATSGVIAFSVEDSGVGIAPENQDRIFAPFEQVDAAADRRYGGTGLGLGIAKELAALLGGELHLRSDLGKGSTFICYLPEKGPVPASPKALAPGAAPDLGVRAALRVEAKPQVLSRGEPFLLLIEDDPVFAATFGEVIQSQGLKYLEARTGQVGLRIAREQRPKGIILDVKLPDMDGWRVMEKLRADPITAAIPVHFVSALDASERGLAMGAVGYLTKPVTRRDLISVIDALAPRSPEGSRRILVVEDDVATGDSVLRLLAAEHLEVQRVLTAREALDAVKREKFGCIILDLSLPDMDGLDLLPALREHCGPEMPSVVVYTARALTKAETATLEAYAEAVVLKDGSSAERLLNEVRLFVRRCNERAGNIRRMAQSTPPADGRLAGRTILVVDDDMRTVYALSATLRAKGMEVLVADTGQVALEVLDKQGGIEAVLMDIMMPEMDGYEAMRRIRKDPRWGKLPIIALTAKAMKGDEDRCLEAGASHYLPKPIDADRLIGLLHRSLSEGAPEGGQGT